LYQRFNLNDFGYIDTGTHVSHFSYTLALALGFKNIIMIGQDLAFDEEGNSHSKGFSYGEQFSEETIVPTLQVQAYGGKGEVLTHITWNDYRIKLEYLFACNE
ncbi:TPA: motility associated factor glycosyltransferase family protein, partial [Campylobacter jejuni]|nr:motility associated factor glycosyltransferase family protein [Campylobacter jejuni]